MIGNISAAEIRQCLLKSVQVILLLDAIVIAAATLVGFSLSGITTTNFFAILSDMVLTLLIGNAQGIGLMVMAMPTILALKAWWHSLRKLILKSRSMIRKDIRVTSSTVTEYKPRWMKVVKQLLGYELVIALLIALIYVGFIAILTDGHHPVEIINRFVAMALAWVAFAFMVTVKLFMLTAIIYVVGSIILLFDLTIMPDQNDDSDSH